MDTAHADLTVGHGGSTSHAAPFKGARDVSVTPHEPEQLELFDPDNDGLDFGTWILSLPLEPDAADEPTHARAEAGSG
jgi:hypothetical protein